MKKRTHKYFRNQRYKEKLKAKAHGSRTYWSHVFWYTKEPDTRDLRESSSSIYQRMGRLNCSLEAAIDKHLEWNKIHTPGRFIYYDRPEVPHSIQKVHTSPNYSRRRKELCKAANRKVRRQSKDGEFYQHRTYKKIYDVAWELD